MSAPPLTTTLARRQDARSAKSTGPLAAFAAFAKKFGNSAVNRWLGGLGARGRQVDPATAAAMSGAYGVDVGAARIIDDAESHAAARALGARAFAIGDTIVVGEGAPPLSSTAGQALLAHELAHVAHSRLDLTDPNAAVSTESDSHEQAATAASQRALRGETADVAAAGPAAAIQRQPVEAGTPAKDMVTRAQAQKLLETYFERTLAAQGGKAVRMTDAVRGTIRRIFINDVGGMLRVDAFLSGTIFPGPPADLAAAVAKFLPDTMDPGRLAHLGASSGPGPTKLERVGDVVKKTAPYESPEALERKWEFDRRGSEMRKGEGTIGPYGVDLGRLYNVGKELPGALKEPPAKKTEAATYPEVEATMAKVSPSALTPAGITGDQAMSYADAQLVAREIARQLDIAHKEGNTTVMLQLGPNYADVKDREAIVTEVTRLVRLIRDALPHHATKVKWVDLHFGEKLVRRILVAGTGQ